MSLDDLSRMSGEAPPSGIPALSSYARVHGNYQSGRSIQIDAAGEFLPQPEGGGIICISQAKVIQTFRPVIRLASEIPPNSCPWREVLQHEQIHYAIDRSAASNAVRASIESASSLPPRFWSARVSSKQEADSFIQSYQQWLLQRVNSAFQQVSQPAQIAHDSPGEYSRVANSCGDDFSKIGYGKDSSSEAVARSAYGAPPPRTSSPPPEPQPSFATQWDSSSPSDFAPPPRAPAQRPAVLSAPTSGDRPYGASNPWIPR